MLPNLDPQRTAIQRIRELHRAFAFTPAADSAWVERFRTSVRLAIGLRTRTVTTSFDVHAVQRLDGYTRQILTFDGGFGNTVFAYLLAPDDAENAPGIVCSPGHGCGVDCIAGVQDDNYQFHYAVQCVQKGFVTLAVEPIGFGHRKSPRALGQPWSCQADAIAALALGETLLGWRVADAMASLDILSSLPVVDPNRLGMVGLSGGGTVTLWTACLDIRVQASLVSGYFCTFLDSIYSIDHCLDNFVPGMATLAEMPDMTALIAPRKLFVESGTEDTIFPVAAFREACSLAQRIYDWAGVPDAFQSHIFEGAHHFDGSEGLPALARWLGVDA